MKQFIIPLLFFMLTVTVGQSDGKSGEIETTLTDQHTLFVTIYNQDMALIKDGRSLVLPKGESTLAVKGVSGRILPETALLTAEKLTVVEQNFEFDLLTPGSLLKKFTGEKIAVIKTHPDTGKETIQQATVLSSEAGVVLEMERGIETGIPGRLLFPYIPDNLRTSPTLTLLVKSDTKDKQELELTYLTRGLTWKADYVAQLDPLERLLDLKGWVTLTNTSMTTYTNADLQLVAGDINIVPQQVERDYRQPYAMAKGARVAQEFSEEQLLDYHLYTLNRKTTLKHNQTKQVALFSADQVSCRKEYLLQGQSYYYGGSRGTTAVKLKIDVYLEVKNAKKNRLGIPLPKGVVRVYKEDKGGKLQFAGEDRIDHLAENSTMRLKLGSAFDITAERKQTDYRKLGAAGQSVYKYQSSYEITLKNGKNEAVQVKVVEPVPGQWRITRQSHAHTKASARHAVWHIEVPAKGETVLDYTVQTR